MPLSLLFSISKNHHNQASDLLPYEKPHCFEWKRSDLWSVLGTGGKMMEISFWVWSASNQSTVRSPAWVRAPESSILVSGIAPSEPQAISGIGPARSIAHGFNHPGSGCGSGFRQREF
jgi:hypothetical protein